MNEAIKQNAELYSNLLFYYHSISYQKNLNCYIILIKEERKNNLKSGIRTYA